MAPSSSRSLATSIFPHLFALFPTHWKRRGNFLGPCQLWLTLITMSARGWKGYARVLDEMKTSLGKAFDWEGLRPTPAALSQSRQKLTRALCESAFEQVLKHCETPRRHPGVRFAGRRLVACDGTNLTLPVRAKVRNHFGVPRCSHGDCLAPQASLTVLYDVGANQPIAFSLEPCRYPERRALLDLIGHLRPNDLLIADRGYPSRALFALLRAKRRDFLIRAGAVHANSMAECRSFLGSGASERTVSLPMLTAEQRDAGEGAKSVTVRLIRFRDDSVLITSLTPRQASADDLRRLYLDRWRIETAFAEMKGFRGLEDFHARTPLGIHQEVTAVFLFMLMESELEGRARAFHAQQLEAETVATASGLHQATDIRFNRLLLGDWVGYLLIAAPRGRRALAVKFKEAMSSLWRARMRYRPNRSFPRETKSPHGKWRLKPRITGKGEALA
jgi:hypothetical protein